MENKLIVKIYNECKEQFEFEEKIRSIVQNDVVNKMNEFIKSDKSDKNKFIDKAITHLACQGIRNYDSSMLLVHHGYSTNALTNLRQMVEIILEIEYILEDENKAYNRANKYLNLKGNKLSKPEKSLYSFNTQLYSLYEILCEYSHANISALNQNEKDNLISIKANDVLVKKASVIVNSTFCYLLESIFRYYKIDKKIIEDINMPEDVSFILKGYNFERDILYRVSKAIGLTEEDISELQIDKKFKEYKIKKFRESKRNKKYKKGKTYHKK